jgi:hypothetical protein
MLSFWKDLSIILAGLIAVITFFTGIWEYRRRTRQERAENLLQMRRRFLETPGFGEILEMLIHQDPAVSHLPAPLRRNFAGVLEEVAILANSHLIRKEVAHYMFGYYVLLTYENPYFCLDRDGIYWSQFRQFAERVQKEMPKTSDSNTQKRIPQVRL